jgi:hypothetical protein
MMNLFKKFIKSHQPGFNFKNVYVNRNVVSKKNTFLNKSLEDNVKKLSVTLFCNRGLFFMWNVSLQNRIY